jgi:cation transport ATPase
LSELINVSTVIFALLVLGTLAGPVFYFFHHYFKSGTVFFQVAAALLTLLLIAGGQQVHRSADAVTSREFKELLTAVIIITGLCITIGIPFLYKHDYI